MNDYAPDPQTIVDYWRSIGPDGWFEKDDAVDATIRQRFGDLHELGLDGELDEWAEEPNGALALVILLDQFSRNLHRDDPAMYAADGKALEIARRAIERGDQFRVGEDLNQFLAMPFMHSEALADHDVCVALMDEIGSEENRKFARHHRDIIVRFGRFPHRNALLGRQSTPEETEFLAKGGFSG